MRILVAPDSFKGSLAASRVAEAMEHGVKKVVPDAQVVKVPLSDGGEGLVDSLVGASGGSLHRQRVTGPLGGLVEAFWGLMGDGKTGVIEMAAASGLTLVPASERNPRIATTYGTGELILATLAAGCRRLIIGIGGSATNDGGAGMAQALGIRLTDRGGKELPFGGSALARLAAVDITGLDPRLQGIEVLVACDVDNPLTGPSGASCIYGPQKGATRRMVVELELALARYALIIRQTLGIQVENQPGAGAAGGLGAGLMAFLGGKLVPGIQLVLEAVGFKDRLKGCDLVLTGEGKMDVQSTHGKVPVGVARQAKKMGIPVVALVGTADRGEGTKALYQEGIAAYFSIVNGPMSLQRAMENAGPLVEDAAAEVMRLWAIRSSGQP